MKLDTFINRPVLSTVISIFIVLLGLIGLASLPITQYPDIAPPTIQDPSSKFLNYLCAKGLPAVVTICIVGTAILWLTALYSVK